MLVDPFIFLVVAAICHTAMVVH